MKRFVAVVTMLLLASIMPTAGLAEGKASREGEMTRTMRAILRKTQEPREVARLLERQGVRFAGYQATTVTYAYDGQNVLPAETVMRSVGPDFQTAVSREMQRLQIRPAAGAKTDFTLTMWLYEWQNTDGTYTEQAMVSGSWSNTAYSWIDAPDDVIDVRWIVGDLAYLSSTPYDGIQRDQHTQGIGSYTVDDQVKNWDLFVNFKPVSNSVYSRWTNVFANYTHTW